MNAIHLKALEWREEVLIRFSLCDADTILNPVAWMENDTIARGQPRDNFSYAVVTLADCHWRDLSATVADGENSPSVSMPEERRDRHRKRVAAAPNRYVSDNTIIVAES